MNSSNQVAKLMGFPFQQSDSNHIVDAPKDKKLLHLFDDG
jgi:hypothetical protein